MARFFGLRGGGDFSISSLLLLTALVVVVQGQEMTDFLDFRSTCGLDCARSGLIACGLTQPDCLCNSVSWFEEFSPCTFDECPTEVDIILEDTIEICNSVNMTVSEPYTSWTSSASSFLASPPTTSTSSTSTSSTSSAPTETEQTTSSAETTPPSDQVTETDDENPPSETDSNNSGSDDNGSGLPVGAIAGIAVGGAIVIGIIVVAAVLIYRRRARRNDGSNMPNPPVQPTHPMSPPMVQQSSPQSYPPHLSPQQQQHQYYPPVVDARTSYFAPQNEPKMPPGMQQPGQPHYGHMSYQSSGNGASGGYSGYNGHNGAYTDQQSQPVGPHMYAAEVDGTSSAQNGPSSSGR